jgi:glucose-1-phosphate cytidylyltransferase
MKVAILAGGFGTRLSEETDIKPKPMVEIGGKPILWHILKTYSHYGFNDFVILLGYKGYVIKEYFANYFLHTSDVTIDMKNNNMEVHHTSSEPWKVTLVDTGVNSMTGGRILRAKKYLQDSPFMLTYGDGVGDIDINQLIACHKRNNKIMTLTSVQPEGRFGSLNIEGDAVKGFIEKPKGDGGWINAGFFVCDPKIFNYITEGDSTIFERTPMDLLINENQLSTYKHERFWKPMDTLRDKIQLEKLWEENKAPWKVWNE